MVHKLALENLIFFRAAFLHARVDGCQGRLVCACRETKLQMLLWVYNTFFAQDNRRNFASPPEDTWGVLYAVSNPYWGSRVPGQAFGAEFNFQVHLNRLHGFLEGQIKRN